MEDSNLVIPDPFPSLAPTPIIPVEEEDVDDPDTGMVERLKLTDPREALKLAQQKVRSSSQQMEKIHKKGTPSEPVRMPPSKKSD